MEDQKHKDKKPEPSFACAICGRIFPMSELADACSGEPLCKDCYAEKESCGCAD
ncbi:MAG: hypothetical protein KKE17_00490 [Proteobacteria bacterium]|nr:hypothetical protein [Pseudomonadota bacterium]MBU1708459.1 hypothetical protein [Pseudomonadota bacterium]